MEVQEHFYSDDPARGPADAKTTLRGVEYFFLGNGAIQAAVQVTPAEGATAVGLLLMDPERLGPKRAALTFDARAGIQATAISLIEGKKVRKAGKGARRARWLPDVPDPRVEVLWRSGPYRVREVFYCPDTKSARLVRRITVGRTAPGRARVRMKTGVGNEDIEKSFTLGRGQARTAVIEYRLSKRRGRPAVRTAWASSAAGRPGAEADWAKTAAVRLGEPVLERFFKASKFQLRAAVSAAGRLDGSIWQYNLEWVRDQAFVAMALAMSGQPSPARTILDRLLRKFISPAGAAVDSSRLRSFEESEFDQNGVLLMALETYANWTGDWELVKKRWRRVERTAAFPLRRAFRHRPSGLLINRREFWERHKAHGIEPGMELAHQVFVALGLEAAGRMARRLGLNARAASWQRAAERLRRAVLHDPAFALVDAGSLIKRKGVRGAVQRSVRPPRDSGLPRLAPLFEAGPHRLNPDTSTALAVAWEFIEPKSALAGGTLDALEALWNERWSGGGYSRYPVSSEPDSPGPWPFPSLFVARAALEAGRDRTARRVLDWLGRVPGRGAASWFEFYGPRPVPPYPQVGIIPWTWAELVLFVVHHLLGVRPTATALGLRPRLPAWLERAKADLPLRGGRLELDIRRARRGQEPGFWVGSRKRPYHPYGLGLPLPAKMGRLKVRALIP